MPSLLFFKYVPNPASFVYFHPFLNTMTNIVQKTINGKSVDGVLGIWTWDRIMEGADESTELWQPTSFLLFMVWVKEGCGKLNHSKKVFRPFVVGLILQIKQETD